MALSPPTYSNIQERRSVVADLYTSGDSMKRISTSVGISLWTVQNDLGKSGVKSRHFSKGRISEETARREISKANRNGQSIQSLMGQHGIGYRSVKSCLNEFGGREYREAYQKHSIQEGAFDVLTEESAYWMGFIATDGCVTFPKGKSPTLSVCSDIKDKDHMQLLANFLGGRPVYETNTPGHNLAIVTVRSNRIVERLVGLGITPKKSLTLYVSKELESSHHFWRGAIDGDGWINSSVGKARVPTMALISGSEKFANQFYRYVMSIGAKPYKFSKVPSSGFGGTNLMFRVTCTYKSAGLVIRSLYQDCCVSLRRKQDRADKILDRYSWP